jgi:hypothetical protein
MKKLFAAALAALSLSAVALPANATTYSVWINGRNSNFTGTNPTWSLQNTWNGSYWADDNGNSIARGVNVVYANWDGTQRISTSNPQVTAVLDAYCTNGNSCYVDCHSAGCAQIGYAEAVYPGRWSIINVYAGGSAAGGSELANVGSWLTGWAIDGDLKTGTMRGMYNHDALGDYIAGWVHTSLGGDWASATNAFFPCHSSVLGVCYSTAANDSVVAFHSSGHFRQVNGNQTDSDSWNSTGGSWWDWTTADFVDANDGSYGHCVASTWWSSIGCKEGNWGGIMNRVASVAASVQQ